MLYKFAGMLNHDIIVALEFWVNTKFQFCTPETECQKKFGI